MKSKVNVASSPDFENRVNEWTNWQKFILVLMATLSSFAIGLSPIVYSFANSSIDNQTPVATPISGESVF